MALCWLCFTCLEELRSSRDPGPMGIMHGSGSGGSSGAADKAPLSCRPPQQVPVCLPLSVNQAVTQTLAPGYPVPKSHFRSETVQKGSFRKYHLFEEKNKNKNKTP